MDVRNCANCGRMFNYLAGPPICAACRADMDDKFVKVKEYIRENPGATINEVSETNDVSPKQIRQWVREERLEFASDSAVAFECESCGATIRTGRFCEACKQKQRTEFAKAAVGHNSAPVEAPTKGSRDPNKMRFL